MSVLVLATIDRSRRSTAGPLEFNRLERAIWLLWLVITFGAFLAAGFTMLGIIGLRYYLAPLLLLLAHATLARDPAQFRLFARHYLWLAGAVCVLGFFQFASPPDAVINRYSWSPNSDMDVATIGEVAGRVGEETYVRITGTFSYISPYASYLQLVLFLAIGMLLTTATAAGRLCYSALVIAILVNLFMTGSRAPVLVSLLLGLLFAPQVKRMLGGRFGFIGLAVGAVIFLVGAFLAQDVARALVERNEMAEDASGRIAGTLLMPLHTIAQSPFWGEGLGKTFLGLGELTGAGTFSYLFDEITQDRLAVEVGIPGYLFFVAVKLYFLLATWRLARNAQVVFVQVWAMVSFAYQASLVWSIPLYNAVAAFYYFFCLALYVWLRGIERAAARSSRQAP
jgi:hypothetical protein